MSESMSDTTRTCHFIPDVTSTIIGENGEEIESNAPSVGCSAFECSICGFAMMYDDYGCYSWFENFPPYKPYFKFCPGCGAKVEVGPCE